MNVIELTGVNKIYDSKSLPVHAVRDVDLRVAEGEFTAIIGPSGSGKTTLLNIIGGIDRPTSGSVRVNGTETTALDAGKLSALRLAAIGFVFQDFSLLPVLTAQENIDLILKLQKKGKKEREKTCAAILKAVGLLDRRNHLPSQLSGGEQQRVAIARALAARPRFVLADEPTANLDTVCAEGLIELMLELNGKLQTTSLFSTHDTRIISRAKRVITIEDGSIVGDTVAAA